MALTDITQKEVAEELKSDAKLLITQTETVDGEEKTVLRRLAVADLVDDTLTEDGVPADSGAVKRALNNKAGADVMTSVKGDIAPAYSASSTYAVGAYVMYNNVLYRCTTAITTAEAWTAAHWTAVNVGGELTQYKQDINELAYHAPIAQNAFVVPANTTHSSQNDRVRIRIDEGEQYGILAPNGAYPYAVFEDGSQSVEISKLGTASKTIIAIGIYYVNSTSSPVEVKFAVFTNPYGMDILDAIGLVPALAKNSIFRTKAQNPTEMFLDLSIENKASGKTYWIQLYYANSTYQQLSLFRTDEGSPTGYDSYKQFKSSSTIDTGIKKYTVSFDSGEVATILIDWNLVPIGTSYSYYTNQYIYNDLVYNGGLMKQFLPVDYSQLGGDITQYLKSPNMADTSFIYDRTLIWYATESGHQGGSTASSGGYKTTSFIDCTSLVSIKGVLLGGGGTVANIAFYNAQKQYISGIAKNAGNTYNVDLLPTDLPTGTAFIRFCTYYTAQTENAAHIELITGYTTLETLKQDVAEIESQAPNDVYWAACGDSITNANHGNIYDIPITDPYMPIDGYPDLNTYKRMNYAYYIAKERRIKWANYGYGGTVLHHCAPKAYSNINLYPFVDARITELKDGIDWDYITIFFGWNDCAYGPIYQRDLWLQATYSGQDIGYPVTQAQIGASGFATQAQKDACDAVTGSVGGVEYNNNNDYFFAKFIGTISDNVKTTWMGAWNYALDYLMRKYPKSKIMIVAPYVNTHSEMVRNSVKAIADKWGVTCFDFEDLPYWFYRTNHQNTPFAPASGYWQTENGTNCNNTVEGYNQARFSCDTLHPSNLGYQTFAKPFGDALFNK